MDLKFNFIYIVEHDVKNFFKYKWWLAGLISMNIADIAILALIFNNIITRFQYFNFVLPGITVGALFASAFAIGREINMELRRMIHHYLLSLPISKNEIIFGRIISGGIRGVMYMSPFLIINIVYYYLLETTLNWNIILLSLVILSILSLGISSLSISMAASTKSFDLYVTLRGLFYFVLLFCSTIFYPIQILDTLPQPIPLIAMYNPVTHGTDILRSALTNKTPAIQNILYAIIFSTAFIIIGAIVYSKTIQRT
ncbi:MAG: ABC transporter permease [Thermoprotei archaeon]